MRALLLALLLLAGPAGAQDGMAEAADRAARKIEEAAQLLRTAQGANDRLAALTTTVRAYEDGLALLRDTLRRVAEERARIEEEISADRESLAALLGTLQSMGQSPGTALLLHPAGPLATARAGMILSDATPALQAKAQSLKEQLDALREVEALQARAGQALREGLSSVQAARADLAAAASARTELPRAYTEDPVATALLMASTESLQDFAAGLDQTVDQQLSSAPVNATDRAGTLPLPVEGTILRRPNEADAAGVTRPGLVIATEPRAMVTVPVTATLRFRGPLLDYGTVAILEPAPGTLFVVAGLAQVWGDAGEILPEGSPLGLMGGETPGADAILTEGNRTGDGGQTESLYLEVRNAEGPVDPGTWFRLD
jgi:septal ring factor EnvC (AmiA/AmiB activator)